MYLIHEICDGTPIVWLNQSSSVQEFKGATYHRTKYIMDGTTELRLIANVSTPGASGSYITAQWSSNLVSWNFFTTGSDPRCPIDVTGFQESPWSVITTGSVGDLYIRIVGSGGNGIADPSIALVALHGQ